MSTAATSAASLPRITYIAPSQLVPGGEAPAQAPQPAQPAAQTQPAEATGKKKATAGLKQALAGGGLLGRVLGLIPLAAGLTQAIAGFFITRGTISLAAVPILGSMPAFLVGSLVAATAMPSIMGGIGKLIGKP